MKKSKENPSGMCRNVRDTTEQTLLSEEDKFVVGLQDLYDIGSQAENLCGFTPSARSCHKKLEVNRSNLETCRRI